MNISKSGLLALIFIPEIVQAGTEDWSWMGKFDCKVVEQRITEMVEGKPEIFGSYKGRFEKGDSLELTYIFSSNKMMNGDYRVYFSTWLTDETRKQSDFTYSTDTLSSDLIGPKPITFRDKHDAVTQVSFDQDEMHFIGHEERLHLQRYYKNDWSGLMWHEANDGFMIQVVGLNCRHANDEIDNIRNSLGLSN